MPTATIDTATVAAPKVGSRRPAAHAWWRPAPRPVHRDGPPERVGADPTEKLLDRSLFDAFAAVARRQPDATAVQVGRRRIGYRDLLAQAIALARRIDAATAHETAVATLAADPVEGAVALLACLAAARPCIALNAHHPSARLADILSDAAPAAVVVGIEGSPCELPAGLRPIPVQPVGNADDPPGLAPGSAPGWASSPAPPDAPCMIIYTSGSTGRPKGIVRSQLQMQVRVAHRIQACQLGPADRVLLLFPLSSGPGLNACLSALLAGAALHVADVAAVGARVVLDHAQEAGVTSVSGVPVLLRTLLGVPGAAAAFAALRSVFCTSESVLRRDVALWRAVLPPGCAILTAYGLTEGSPLADWFLPQVLPGNAARLPVGYPLEWHEFAITDAAGAPVAEGEPGELWARGRLLSLGEWQKGRCVPGRLLPDPDDPARDILPTGDLVRRLPDGILEFLGRVDDQIRIRGNRVEPAEVVHVLRQVEGVADAAVLARRGTGDPVLVAFLVPDGVPDGPAELALREAALRETATKRLRETLPPFMLPARLHVIRRLPSLPGGKLDQAGLAQLDDARHPRRGPG